MAKAIPWSTTVTPQLRDALMKAGDAAYDNGVDLLSDAQFLLDNGREARALALAVLADEEFCKAFVLVNSAAQGRWDSVLFDALKRHSKKQGVALIMRAFVAWYKQSTKLVFKAPIRPWMHPSLMAKLLADDEKWQQILKQGADAVQQPTRDSLKQDALYVDIDKAARIVSKPNKFGVVEAQEQIDLAIALQKIVEQQGIHQHAALPAIRSRSPFPRRGL